MRFYIEEKMKDVQPIPTKEPIIQAEIEENVDENIKVRDYTLDRKE